jgi:peptide/nickel transport system substrate-binding protein
MGALMTTVITRRRLLGTALGAGAGLIVFGACSSENDNNRRGAQAGNEPVRADVLRVGALGKASAITRDPHGVQANESDFLILSLVYEALTMPGPTTTVAPRLMQAWEPNADLTRWRFTIDEGVTFHDGSLVTAEDVVWSLQRLRATAAGSTRMPGIEPGGIAADGASAVVLTSSYPNSEAPLLMRLATFILKKDTTEVAGSPGTGPFKLEWFREGNARLVRNDNWHGGEVGTEAIEVRMFDSPAALGNAVVGGQIDVASNVGAVVARTAKDRDGVTVIRRPDDTSIPLVMRAADGPFQDVRVRQALRLAVDRQALVDQVLSGYGAVANDILGTGDAFYPRDIPQRRRDLATASRLLDEAAFNRADTHELFTTEDIPGLAEAATLLATQVAEVGVKVKAVKQDTDTFYDRTWLKAPLYMTYWGTNDSLAFYASKTMLSDAAQNEAAWKDQEFDAAYRVAIGSADEAARREHFRKLAELQRDRSGYLLWGMADGVDVASTKVHDLPKIGGYGRVLLEKAWVEA